MTAVPVRQESQTPSAGVPCCSFHNMTSFGSLLRGCCLPASRTTLAKADAKSDSGGPCETVLPPVSTRISAKSRHEPEWRALTRRLVSFDDLSAQVDSSAQSGATRFAPPPRCIHPPHKPSALCMLCSMRLAELQMVCEEGARIKAALNSGPGLTLQAASSRLCLAVVPGSIRMQWASAC